MKNIYLWVTGEGWIPFEFGTPTTQTAIQERGIYIHINAKIGYNAEIGDNAKIGYNAEIGDNAKIGYNAEIGDNAKIGYNAEIGDNAKIGYNAEIAIGEIILKTIFITGSSHSISWWGKGNIQIGCHNHTIGKWLKDFERIGEYEDYSKEQITEYGQYIKFIAKLQEGIVIEKRAAPAKKEA